MSRKIMFRLQTNKTVTEVWSEFILSQTTKGVSTTTIKNYHQVLHNITRFFDVEMPIGELTKSSLEEMIVKLRDAGLAHNTVATYVRVVRTFLNWCRSENIVDVTFRQSFSLRDSPAFPNALVFRIG